MTPKYLSVNANTKNCDSPQRDQNTNVLRNDCVSTVSAFLHTSCTRLTANADFLRLISTMKQLACGVLCGSPHLQMSWRHDYPAADSSEGEESCCHNWLLVSLQRNDGKVLGCWSDRRRVQECLKPNSAPSWLGNLAKLLHTPRYVSLSVQWDQDLPVQVLVRIEINQKEIIRKDPRKFFFPLLPS